MTFDVSHRATHFTNNQFEFAAGIHQLDAADDLIGNVGNHLDGLAQIVSLAFPVEHFPVDLPGGGVVEQ